MYLLVNRMPHSCDLLSLHHSLFIVAHRIDLSPRSFLKVYVLLNYGADLFRKGILDVTGRKLNELFCLKDG